MLFNTQLMLTLSQSPPQICPFRQDDFLRSLEHAGPQLTCILKGDWLGLYRWENIGHRLLWVPQTYRPAPQLPLAHHRRFFKSPHFDGWYRQRHKEMAQKLEALHLEAICEAVREGKGRGIGTGPGEVGSLVRRT